MIISYENTPEDALNFYACWLKNTKAGQNYLRRIRVLRGIAMAVLGILTPLFFGLTLSVPSFLLAALLLAFVFGTAGYFGGNLDFKGIVSSLTKMQNKSGALKIFLGPKSLTVTPEGLRTAWTDGEMLRKWSALQRIEENETHLMLIFGESDFTAIPKRAFRDAAHQQEFLAAVERYRTGAGAITANGASPVAAPVGAPWWRNRSAVDANEEKTPLQQRRP